MAYLKPQAFIRHVVNPLVSRLQTGAGGGSVRFRRRLAQRATVQPAISMTALRSGSPGESRPSGYLT